MKPQLASLVLSFTAISGSLALHRARRPSSHSLIELDTNTELLALHKSLCEIPSVTNNEAAIGDWLATYLESHSFTVEKQPVGASPGRNNIYAYPGKNRNTTTLLTSHIDTVGPFIPYTIYSNGTIIGRGANDAKGPVAAQVIAFKELFADGVIKEGDVSLLFVVGEEVNAAGMVAANNLGVPWKAVIFGEPTENKLSLGHKGAMSLVIEAHGRAAHSGYPHLGINANRHLVEALYTLDRLVLPRDDVFGETTVNYGVFGGGVASNVVSAFANASLTVRLAVGRDEVKTAIDDGLRGKEVKLVYAEGGYGPQTLDHDVEGFETALHSYGTDIPYLQGNHKKYLYGPGSITTAHGDHESVTVADLEEAVEGYKKLMLHTLS